MLNSMTGHFHFQPLRHLSRPPGFLALGTAAVLLMGGAWFLHWQGSLYPGARIVAGPGFHYVSQCTKSDCWWSLGIQTVVESADPAAQVTNWYRLRQKTGAVQLGHVLLNYSYGVVYWNCGSGCFPDKYRLVTAVDVSYTR
jgi:hypothetical protein